ncbi:MAG: hypothetical protein AWU54_299 [Candidatus Frackibacter sp. T328-2]|nr:MAG: hypothetical protein AWU54_299 [Candidatus Frackibacter sp. T328-2]
MSQKELALATGYSEARISQLLNQEKLSDTFLKSVVNVLNSKRLQLLVDGDTTNSIYFDRVRIDLNISMMRLKKECLELIEAIEEVEELQTGNVTNVSHCNSKQEKAFYYVLGQAKDVNHCCEHFDIAADDAGFDLDKRDNETTLKYLKNKYCSPYTTKDTRSGKASVSM